jgi:hypothetical protein
VSTGLARQDPGHPTTCDNTRRHEHIVDRNGIGERPPYDPDAMTTDQLRSHVAAAGGVAEWWGLRGGLAFEVGLDREPWRARWALPLMLVVPWRHFVSIGLTLLCTAVPTCRGRLALAAAAAAAAAALRVPGRGSVGRRVRSLAVGTGGSSGGPGGGLGGVLLHDHARRGNHEPR